MTTGGLVLLAITIICCTSAVVAYIAEFRSLQNDDYRPLWISILIWIALPVWLVIAISAALPMAVARWLKTSARK